MGLNIHASDNWERPQPSGTEPSQWSCASCTNTTTGVAQGQDGVHMSTFITSSLAETVDNTILKHLIDLSAEGQWKDWIELSKFYSKITSLSSLSVWGRRHAFKSCPIWPGLVLVTGLCQFLVLSQYFPTFISTPVKPLKAVWFLFRQPFVKCRCSPSCFHVFRALCHQSSADGTVPDSITRQWSLHMFNVVIQTCIYFIYCWLVARLLLYTMRCNPHPPLCVC